MLVSGEGIVLHGLKYSENSLIVTVYTRKWGRQAYIVTISRSRKSTSKAGMLQPLFLLNFIAYQKETREVQRIKELKIQPVYQSIPFDIVKSTQAIFLAEILYKVLREQESSPDTYDFIQNALLFYDLKEAMSNFHLWFLLRLTSYIGILPDISRAGYENWFDIKKGAVVPHEPAHPLSINKEATEVLIQLSGLKINEIQQIKMKSTLRNYLTEKITEYYQHHFEHLGTLKSMKVLHEVFS